MIFAGLAGICWLGSLFVMLFVASALLRGGIALANRVIGVEKSETIIGWDWDSDEDDQEIAVDSEKPAIPEPGISRSMVIVFLLLLAEVMIGFVLSVILDGPIRGNDTALQVATVLIGGAGGFVTLMGLLAWMLPTTPKRAALATAFTSLIVIAVATLVAGIVAIVLG